MSDEKLPKPSDDFMDAVCTFGTPSADCGLCGITHFATGEQSDWDRKELDDLRRKAAESPGRYMEHPEYDGLSMGLLDGRQVIWCCPCNKASKYEQFIWDNREIILTFLARKTKAMRNEVEATERLVSQVGQ